MDGLDPVAHGARRAEHKPDPLLASPLHRTLARAVANMKTFCVIRSIGPGTILYRMVPLGGAYIMDGRYLPIIALVGVFAFSVPSMAGEESNSNGTTVENGAKDIYHGTKGG